MMTMAHDRGAPESLWQRLRVSLRRWMPWLRPASSASSAPVADPADPGPHLRFGLLVCAAVVLGFGGWAALASLQSAVVAPGVITAEGRTRSVQHLDGGTIAQILVRDGAVVEEGDILVRMDRTRLDSERAILENRLIEALARQARLEAERDETAVMSRPALMDRVVEESPAVTADLAAQVFSGQQKLFQARRDTLKAQVSRLEAAIAQSREQASGIVAQRASLQRQEALIGRELDGTRSLYEKELVTLPRVLALEREQAGLEGNIAARSSEMAAIEQSIGQLQLQILELERDTREKVLTELREADANVQDLGEQRIAALDRLQRADIRAPVRGRVNGLAFHTIGGVVKPADALMEIVPEDEALVVEARADPAAVDQLHAGQAARIRLTAFDQQSTPELDGMLVTVSPDRLTDPHSGAPYYALKVAISDEELKRLGADKPLVSGMPADVFVVAGARSPLSYLMKPLTDQMARALREE